MKASKKLILTTGCLIGLTTTVNAMTPRRCLEGAVWEVNNLGEEELVDCAKWERPVEARVAEKDALSFLDEEVYVVQKEEPNLFMKVLGTVFPFSLFIQ